MTEVISPIRRRLLSLTRMGVFRPHQLSDNSDLHLIHRSRKKSNRNSCQLINNSNSNCNINNISSMEQVTSYAS